MRELKLLPETCQSRKIFHFKNYLCKCGETKPENFYKGYKTICKKCKRKQARTLYLKNKMKWYFYFKENFDLRCARCGYDKCFAALEFHHKNPAKRDFYLGNIICGKYSFNQKQLEKVLKELEKCELLCSCCHKEEHYLQKELKLFKLGEKNGKLC